MTAFDRNDVQGLVVSGYGQNMPEARYLLLRVGDAAAARRWIGDVAGRVTVSDGPQPERCINLAFTHAGLAALGVADADLRSFAPPFQEGMASPHRQRLLGDTDGNGPEHWHWGGTAADRPALSSGNVHAVLLLFGKDVATMQAVEQAEVAALSVGGAFEVILRLTPEPLPGRTRVGKFGVEHFGFADGMSQPAIKGTGQEDKLTGADARRSVIEAGEFVLGLPNGYGQLTPWPRLSAVGGGADGTAFGVNGTYLVVRQLAQDVAGFWQFLDKSTKRSDGSADPEARELLGAKLVGRWRSGAPLVRSEHRDDPDLGTDNSFGYAEVDPHGHRCPLGAHIRRSNPRDALGSDRSRALELANNHRLVRRGRVYGPGLDDPLAGDDQRERGLFFICVNANIERQFEFVQHSWCNNSKFDDLYDEQDPLLGAGGARSFTLQAAPLRRRVHGMPSFVTTRGGAYFFLPGVRGLRMLATYGPGVAP